MQTEKHIINRVFLEVHTRSSKTAYELKDHLDVYLKEKLLPYLEDYFDSLMKTLGPDTHFQLEKIDIDLSASEPLDLTDLKFRIKNQIEKEIEVAQVLNRSEVILSPEDRLQDQFLHFLETGMNPWWNHSTKITALEDPIELKALMSSRKFTLELRKRVHKSSFRDRMIKQLSDVQLVAIIKKSRPSKSASVQALKAGAINKMPAYIKKGVAESGPLTLAQRRLLWDIVLCTVLNPSGSEIKKKIMKLIKSMLQVSIGDYRPLSLDRMIFEFLKAKTPVIVLSDFEDQVVELKKQIKIAIFESNKKTAKKKSFTKDDATPGGEPTMNNERENLATTLDGTDYDKMHMPVQSEETTTFETPADHYVENAGLILLHPYLKQLFLNCELLHLDKITDPEKAIHLLHYLATGEEGQFEHQMVFEKFLCTIPITRSINRQVELSSTLKRHADEMLIAAVQHWSAMKTASIALLRNEFLQRPGKLILTENNPKIIMEKKTQDILLDKLPWNLGLCKLPWRDKIIFTDW